LKDRQTTFSKEVCIKKYGEVEGLRVWQERQKLWKSKVFNDNQWLGGGVSKVSNELFEKIISLSNLKSVDTLYGIKNEKFISNNKTHYKYDFTYLPTKKIIEFNGDYWHCNPDLYKADYYHKIKKMTARKIWDYDNVKIATAKHHGYDILVIWEDDYRKEPNKVINKCINFLIN
jgi:very-short-patch-repair endonuclease